MKKTIILLGAILMSLSLNAQVAVDGDKAHGGDECEGRIISIRDDVKLWINDGGADNLELPEEIPLASYKKEMLKAIEETVVSCTTETITVHGAEKTCYNEPGKIVCNIERFMELTSESGQYRLIHHEYAGLSGFETNDGEAESQYFISKQIIGFLEPSKKLKLVVNKSKSNFVDLCQYGKLGTAFSLFVDAETCAHVEKDKLLEITEFYLHIHVPGVESFSGTLKKGIFSVLTSLKVLDISTPYSAGGFEHIELGVFDSLVNLKRLNLSDHSIGSVSVGMFEKLSSLTSLSLANNKLKEISLGMFKGLDSLIGLDLRGNLLVDLEDYALSDMGLLESLYLDYNDISNLDKNFFSKQNLSSIKHIGLTGNPINYIDVNAFDGLMSLDSLDLSETSLESITPGTFSKLLKLESLNLKSCEISKINKGTFGGLSSLEILNLKKNNIIEIEGGSFTGLESIFSLNLDENNITYIDAQTFRGLEGVEWISLNKNQIIEIEKGAFKHFSNIKGIDFSNNLITKISRSYLGLSPDVVIKGVEVID